METARSAQGDSVESTRMREFVHKNHTKANKTIDPGKPRAANVVCACLYLMF